MKYRFDDDFEYEDVVHRHPGKPSGGHSRKRKNSGHRDKHARTSGKWSWDDWNDAERPRGHRKLTKESGHWH